MPLRITILSGDRQGQQLEFDQDVIEIGDQPTDDVGFEVATNPGISKRRATLKCHDGRWQVCRSGEMPIFLNQEMVSDTADLRSGDYLRMSHDGPDLSCEFIGQLSPLVKTVSPVSSKRPPAAKNPKPPTVNRAPETAAAASESRSSTDTAITPPPTKASSPIRIIAAALLAVTALIVISVVAWTAMRPDAQSANEAPAFVPFGVIVVDEGEQVFWRPTLTQSDPSDRFQLGSDAPTGMTIDESTGTIRWQTSEADGPGEFRCQVTVNRGDTALSRSDWLEIRVNEINQSPQPNAIATQSVNLLETDMLSVKLSATDGDLPRQELSYQLSPDVPDGVQLDSKTGELTWQIGDQYANDEWNLSYFVSDGSQTQPSQGTVRVRVSKPDPWDIAQQKLRDSLYLIVTETKPGKLIVPLGTACAIDERTLLTSASVAHGINDARGRDWPVLAVDTRDFELVDPVGWKIDKVQTHAAYVRAQSIEDPQSRALQESFFDLALLTTDRELPATCDLGDVEAKVKNDQTVAFLGFAIEGGSLSNFDSMEPAFQKVQVLSVVPPPTESAIQGRPPFLLQLLGKLPIQPFGSLIVDEQGDVLAIYAFQADLPEDVDSDPVHYAVDSMHAAAFLNQKGLDLWIETNPIPPNVPTTMPNDQP